MINEGFSILPNEYSLYETIIRRAFGSVLLLGNDENFKKCHEIKDCPFLFSNDELKYKTPRKDINSLLFYY